MGQFLSYAIPGIPYGCTFAIVAVGLVLTYQATGVFNFAFGAQAYVSAYVYALLTEHGMNRFGAFAVSVLLLAPLLGLLFDRLLFSRIARANVTAKIVSALGLFVGLPSLLAVVFGSATRYAPPSVLFNSATVYFHVGSTPINGIELATVIVTVVVVVALMVLLRYTAYGLKMRAAVESGRLLELDGVNASAVVSSAWMISSLLAGLAGVLLAPQYPTVSSNTYAVLLVAAIAAAALGALRSIPLALVGGIALGVVEGLASGYFAPGSILHTGLLPAIPFLALVFLLLFLPGMRSLDEPNDPLSSVDPPIPPSITTTRSRDIDRVVRVGRWALAIFFVFSVLTWVPGNWVFTLSTGIALSTIFLSITLITGMGGQLSLCQATFAGIGAFAAGQLALHAGLPILLGAVTGALLAAVIGAVSALPALRLRGLPLALLTLSFALLADYVAFPPSWAGGPVTGLNVPRPQIGPINFATSSTRAFFLLALVMLVLASTVVLLIQRGTLGRFLGAMRGSPVGAASIGINLSWTKVLLFALSAGLAGLGGAVYGSLQQVVTPVDFNYEFSLIFVVVVVTTGVNTVEGAIQAGIGFVVIQQLLSYLPGRAGSGSLTVLLFALGALTYARHPEGVVEYQKRIWTERFEGLFDRRNPQGQGELALPGGSPGGAS